MSAVLRNHLLPPIRELFEAAALLHKAAIAHTNYDDTSAKALILQTDIDPSKRSAAIFDWSEALFGGNVLSAGRKISPEVKAQIFTYFEDPDKPRSVPPEQRASGVISKGLAKEVINRDGYFCRFCGIPVIDPRARVVLWKAYPRALRWVNPDPQKRPRNIDKHIAFQALELNLDHILPRSRGGQNTRENIIVTCAPCNCGRSHHTLAEMGLADPMSRTKAVPAGFEDWSGLTVVLNRS
jgi:5-methylcytosine-specific restriction endonuclease McrA